MVAFTHPKTVELTVCAACADSIIKKYLELGYQVLQVVYNVSDNVYIILMEQDI